MAAKRTTRRGNVGATPVVRRAEPSWARLADDDLLNVRLCDLGLRIKGTILERRIKRLYSELERHSVRLRPHFWLSSDWFTPDGVPGSAMPFYLAHPRLMRLEEKQMLEVEGGTHEWSMRLLRHEAAHAIANAYRIYRRRSWQQLFGKSSQSYPQYYQPRPYSKRFVLHLDYWYAQSHPTEDFAETLAVWLAPGSQWRRRYDGWPALKKLEYVDELMRELAGKKPIVTSHERVEPLDKLRTTLRRHYERKRARYGTDYPSFYDRDLRQLFADHRDHPDGELAARFLSRNRAEIRRLLARWTGEFQYTIDQVFREMIVRCRELKLRVRLPEEQAKLEATALLSVQTMNYLHSGYHRVAL